MIKDAIGKVRSYRSNRANWEASGKKKGKPGLPAASDHPTLYQGCIQLQLEDLDLKAAFVRINVSTRGMALDGLPGYLQPLGQHWRKSIPRQSCSRHCANM